jgi:2-succinyl-6-hydroxy-2,4-cyclohexadiene-1-carboxylate synthase
MSDTPLPYYEVHGDQGPYLLLVHGMLSGRSQWLANLEALKQVCRPVIMELWGHGRSSSPEDPELYQHDAYIHFFERIRKEIAADDWFVCGQSFGATLSFRYIIAHPDRVLGHIFTNSVSAFGGVDSSAENQQRIKTQAERILVEGRSLLEKMPIHPKHATRLPEVALKALLEDAALLNPLGIANTFRYVTQSSVTDILTDITVPNLLVSGIHEKAFKAGQKIAMEKIPKLVVVEVEAGHAVNIQGADEFNRAVAGFIQQNSHE